MFERTAIAEICGNPDRAECVIADRRHDAGGHGAAADHAPGIRLRHGLLGQHGCVVPRAAPLRQAPVMLPVSSFVAEAHGRPPEVAQLSCVGVTETAAEKLVALTRRIAMELAGLSRDPDPTLVRHIYDLHLMQGHIDPGQVAALARDIAAADAQEFRNQYPAYAADIAGETRKALDALRTDPAYRSRYDDFVIAMAYGERPEFDSRSRLRRGADRADDPTQGGTARDDRQSRSCRNCQLRLSCKA